MERKELLLDSVRKLIELGVGDEEILSNLTDAGVSRADARSLLELARPGPKPVSEKPTPVMEDFPRRRKAAETPVEIKPFREEKTPSFEYKPFDFSFTAPASAPSPDISALWEKGIITTVDAKLEEMRRIRSELTEVLDSKVNERMESALKRVNLLFESQKTIILSKTSSELESKSREISGLIDGKITELKSLNFEVKNSLNELRKENQMLKVNMDIFESKSVQLDDLRSKASADVGSAMAKAKMQTDSLLSDFVHRRDELEARVNKTLELQQKIMEGLMQDVRQRLDKVFAQKESDLVARVNEKLAGLQELEQTINPARIEEEFKRLQRVNEELERKATSNEVFIKFKEEMQSWAQSYVSEFSVELKNNLQEILQSKSRELEDRLSSKTRALDELNQKVDVREIAVMMEELETYKKQFVGVVKENVQSYNNSKKELTELMLSQSRSIDERIKAIDAKIAELNTFEQNFAKEMGIAMEKLTDRKK
ncbi:MAG: hypothetical protein HY917_00280 [Candidatus Diapherotrites archaeon]|nr:hypothetical protein [Candidatus Diapherotrites archaeon]